MTELSKMPVSAIWEEIEMWFDGIEGMLSHRCYQPHSMAGVRSIQFSVAGHLKWIDEALLEIEERREADNGKR